MRKEFGVGLVACPGTKSVAQLKSGLSLIGLQTIFLSRVTSQGYFVYQTDANNSQNRASYDL